MSDRAWVATRKGLLEWRMRGGRWSLHRVSFAGEPASQLLPPDPRSPGRPMIAALNLGHFGVKCHASTDEGVTWSEVGTPQYPVQPEASHTDVPWKLVQIWSLAAKGDRIFAGTLPGGLFHSDDFGASWHLDRALWDRPERLAWFGGGFDVPGIHSIVLHPHEHGRRLVGISCGGAWQTRDDGASWSLASHGMVAAFMPPELAEDPNIQDPHCIAACASDPSVLWCQHHNGIFRSTDGASRWQRVQNVPIADFGFAVAAHPIDPLTAWFVPGIKDECRIPPGHALTVLRTTDGGRTFIDLRDGLPQQDCFDLIYRHGLAVTADGRGLMMGSTTGNLWHSANGGEQWQTLSANLPPIHAITFASD